MAMFHNGIYIFICQIDTTRKTHTPVNNGNFTVIPVVMNMGKNR
jgi:uncharacterized protein YlaI